MKIVVTWKMVHRGDAETQRKKKGETKQNRRAQRRQR